MDSQMQYLKEKSWADLKTLADPQSAKQTNNMITINETKQWADNQMQDSNAKSWAYHLAYHRADTCWSPIRWANERNHN
jgi:hypothetical protein